MGAHGPRGRIGGRRERLRMLIRRFRSGAAELASRGTDNPFYLLEEGDIVYVPDSVKTGYEISFTRYFYKPQPLGELAAVVGAGG